MNSFIQSQYSHCVEVWMFTSRKLNDKMNSIHKRALQAVYLDYSSTFAELLEKDKSVTIHQRNIQLVAIEMFKASKGKQQLIPTSKEIHYPGYSSLS